MKTLVDFAYNGEAAVEFLLKHSNYGSIEQAIASLVNLRHKSQLFTIH